MLTDGARLLPIERGDNIDVIVDLHQVVECGAARDGNRKSAEAGVEHRRHADFGDVADEVSGAVDGGAVRNGAAGDVAADLAERGGLARRGLLAGGQRHHGDLGGSDEAVRRNIDQCLDDGILVDHDHGLGRGRAGACRRRSALSPRGRPTSNR